MVFKAEKKFISARDSAVEHYLAIDASLARDFLNELDRMVSHLEIFPEACPLTYISPVRKYLLKKFPYRVRYLFKGDRIILLTMEHMHDDHEL